MTTFLFNQTLQIFFNSLSCIFKKQTNRSRKRSMLLPQLFFPPAPLPRLLASLPLPSHRLSGGTARTSAPLSCCWFPLTTNGCDSSVVSVLTERRRRWKQTGAAGGRRGGPLRRPQSLSSGGSDGRFHPLSLQRHLLYRR